MNTDATKMNDTSQRTTHPEPAGLIAPITIHSSHVGWDHSLPATAEVVPGDIIEIHAQDASGGQLNRNSTNDAVRTMDSSRANPLTGPIRVVGAQPGDALVIDILEFGLSDWGWTALIPGFGLLADQFPDPYLHVSEYDGKCVHFTPEITLATQPFPGTIGVAPAEPGRHSVIPPRRVGGNMDCPHLTAGTRLSLPVEMPGALLSVGDTHAAQGDGEVCGTAIETSLSLRLRIDLKKSARLTAPRLDVPPKRARTGAAIQDRGWHVTCGIAPDLMQAVRNAIHDMIHDMTLEYGLEPQLAYCLCSVAVDLKVSEVVDAPNWMVTAHLPRGIFR